MNKFLSYAAVLLVGLGLGYSVFHNGAPSKVGGYENPANFVNGFFAGLTDQFSVDTSGNASTTGNLKFVGSTNFGTSTTTRFASFSIGTSSTTPAALGSALSGFFTATGTTQSASTTAVTSNSQIFLQQTFSSSTAPSTLMGNSTCNQTPATTTVVSSIIAGNGFIIKPYAAPSGGTTPNCYFYWIIN